MLPVCLGDWRDWCHGVLEPLKCRPFVNTTKARPAFSPGWNILLNQADNHAAQSQIDTCRDTCTRSHVMYGHSSAVPNYRPPDQQLGSEGYNDTLIQGYQPAHTACWYLSGFLLLSHLILLHLITPVLKLFMSGGGRVGMLRSLCSKETKQKRHHANSPFSRFLSQNTKIITRASKYAMFEIIFFFVVVASCKVCWY